MTTSSFSRLHRQRKHLKFTNACKQRKVIPAFCKLSYKTIRTNKIRSNEVKKFETRRLSDAIRENKEKILKLENNFESSKNLLFIPLIVPNILTFYYITLKSPFSKPHIPQIGKEISSFPN